MGFHFFRILALPITEFLGTLTRNYGDLAISDMAKLVRMVRFFTVVFIHHFSRLADEMVQLRTLPLLVALWLSKVTILYVYALFRIG